jgi:ion channel
MTLGHQLMWGSLYLCICLILETVFLVWCSTVLNRRSKTPNRFVAIYMGKLILIAIGFILIAHTAQIWIWASAFVLGGAIADWNTAIYFSLVTYTTLGYGDVVLGPGLRIFAAFAAVTGLLGFGISTAFLVTLVGRILQTPKINGSEDT